MLEEGSFFGIFIISKLSAHYSKNKMCVLHLILQFREDSVTVREASRYVKLLKLTKRSELECTCKFKYIQGCLVHNIDQVLYPIKGTQLAMDCSE